MSASITNITNKHLSKRSAIVLCLLVGLLLGWHWVTTLAQALEVHGVLGDRSLLPGLLQWLVSWAVLLLLAGLVGLANFRYLYTPFNEKRFDLYLYVTTQMLLVAAIFEILQWRSDHEPELADANLLLAFVSGAFFFAFNLIGDAIMAKRRQEVLLRQKTDAELKLLQSQINPHFLFNALNSIYSKALKESDGELPDQIAQLSVLLRFSIEKAGKDRITIKEELDFIEKYINLQLTRWPGEVRKQIEVDIETDEKSADITPMLLQPWIENAFKFGLEDNNARNCCIKISLSVFNHRVTLFVQNSKQIHQPNFGMGKAISNVKARLASIYPNKHHLLIKDEETLYTVNLTIQLD